MKSNLSSAPNGLHFGSVFAVAAAEAKLEHIVMVGQWLSSPDHLSMLMREVWLNKEVLKLLRTVYCCWTNESLEADADLSIVQLRKVSNRIPTIPVVCGITNVLEQPAL